MCITAFLTTSYDDILPYLSKPKLWCSALQDASGYKENSKKPFNLQAIYVFNLNLFASYLSFSIARNDTSKTVFFISFKVAF